MSIDVAIADPISLMSPWQIKRAQLFAAREIAADALRRELANLPAIERTPGLVQEDIDRYTGWLKVEPVRKNSRWWLDVQAKRDAAVAELAAMTGGAQ
jgi:hypothetical protein